MDNLEKLSTISIISAFLNELKCSISSDDILKLTLSNFHVFNIDDKNCQEVAGLNWYDQILSDSKFDIILADLPLGLNRVEYKYNSKKIKIRRNWVELLKALKFLKKDGLGVFLLEPTVFSSNEGIKFENIMNSEGYYIQALFNAPQGILLPHTSITPVFAIINTKSNNSIFIAELLNETLSA